MVIGDNFNKIKVLNLFAGIGGNVSCLDRSKYEITSVEFNDNIAKVYKNRFPYDHVVVGDAYLFLLDHYNEYDFIWASPPCQSHNRTKFSCNQNRPYYVDLGLYKVIIFLQKWCYDKKWCVENVFPYYEPLIKPSYIFERHFLWTNFIVNVRNRKSDQDVIENSNIDFLLKYHNIDSKIFDGVELCFYEKRQCLRNCCSSWFSEIIDNCFNKEKKEKYFQLSLDI